MTRAPMPSNRVSLVHGRSHMKLPPLLFSAPASMSLATVFPTSMMNRTPGMVNLWR
jgi:hypothetical protein